MLTCLKYLNSNDVYHCDIKPENVLLDSKFKPVIIDFGFLLLKKKRDEIPLNNIFKLYYLAP